jgi:hypothetical protein
MFMRVLRLTDYKSPHRPIPHLLTHQLHQAVGVRHHRLSPKQVK